MHMKTIYYMKFESSFKKIHKFFVQRSVQKFVREDKQSLKDFYSCLDRRRRALDWIG